MIFWSKKRKLWPKTAMFGSKPKKKYGEGEYCWFLTAKKEYSENLKIKWTYSRKEDRILIKNVSLNYSKKECWCSHDSTLMVHAWRKQSMISLLKPDKEKNQWHVPIKKLLRDPSIKKNLEIILCTISFILIYLISLEVCKECLMR